jgi:hypothetical protein
MITCDEFQSEGKGTNAYTMSCFARFIFTTNNDNCLRVNPDSRRFFVVEVSSELKGDTDYFRRLSTLIDDPNARRVFYDYLVARDLVSVDWINDKPSTDYFAEMVSLNLPYEHQFFKHVVLQEWFQSRHEVARVTKRKSDELFQEFTAWLKTIGANARCDVTAIRFGFKLSKLVYSSERRTGFRGLTKKRSGGGIVYVLDIKALAPELVERKWMSREELT